MENRHLAAFWRFLDRGFCRDGNFTDLILVRILAIPVCPLFGCRRVSPCHPLVGLRCRVMGMRQGPVLAQLGPATGTEIR